MDGANNVHSTSNSITKGFWSSADQILTLSVDKEIVRAVNVTIPKEFGFVLPTRGVTSSVTHLYSFVIYRGSVKLTGKTSLSEIHLFSAIYNPLMRFTPVPEAGAIVDLRIWVTFSASLPSGTNIKWRLPGFVSESLPRLFITTDFSDPRGALPEASWLADDGTGAGVLTVRVGSASVGANVPLRIEIPRSAGIRLPLDGTPSCVEGTECRISISCDAATGPLPTTAFRGSDLIGIVSAASLSLKPRQTRVPVEMTLSFVMSFDLREGDVLAITLRRFQASSDSLRFNPGGLCQPGDGGNPRRCFRDVQYFRIQSRDELFLFAEMDLAMSRGSMISLIFPESAGLSIPAHGLPRLPSAQGPAGINLIFFEVSRLWSSTTAPLPESGPAERSLQLIPKRRFVDVPLVGSFKPLKLEIKPNYPGTLAQISLNLMLSMSLVPTEHINLDLKGFFRIGNLNYDDAADAHTHALSHSRPVSLVWLTLIEGPWDENGVKPGAKDGVLMNATWDEGMSRLSIENRGFKDAGTMLTLSIETSQGFVTPPNGILFQEALPLISSDSIDGPVDPTPFGLPNMNSYIVDTEIMYKPPRAASVAQISLGITTNAVFQVGDILRFTLKNFTGGLWCWASEEYMASRCVLETATSDPTKCEFGPCAFGCRNTPPERRGCKVRLFTATGTSLELMVRKLNPNRSSLNSKP